MATSKPLDEKERARLDKLGAGYLPKSTLTDGAAAAELRRICSGLGLSDLLADQAANPAIS